MRSTRLVVWLRTALKGSNTMPPAFAPLLLIALIAMFGPVVPAQDIEARVYGRAPVGTNFAALAYTHQSGDVVVDPTLRLGDIKAKINALTVGYAYTFNLAKRQATASVALSYIQGRISGNIFEEQPQITRSGIADMRLRLMVNLIGSPALNPREFATRKPSTILGASFTMVAPTGQYDPVRLVNIGTNRFSFKPELGLSHPVGKWTLELLGGVWLFTENKKFFSNSRREQNPLPSFQGHINYNLRPRLWFGVGAAYYFAGRSIVNGLDRSDYRANLRVGITASIPITQAHSVKVIYAKGVVTRIGINLDSISVAWQYTWLK